MARVANCPQCSREMLIDEGTDSNAWAKCPECRAFFQIGDAAAREIRSALLVGSESTTSNVDTVLIDDTAIDPVPDPGRRTVSRASFATISEPQSSASDVLQNGAHTQPQSDVLNAESIDLEIVSETDASATDEPEASGLAADAIGSRPTERRPRDSGKLTELRAAGVDSAEDSTERIDKWFRTEKSRIESSRNAEFDGTIVFDAPPNPTGLGTDFELELETTSPESPDSWDDTVPRDQLLADVQRTLEEQELAESVSDSAEWTPEAQEFKPVRPPATELPPAMFMPPGRLPRRKKSAVRMLVGIVTSSVVGLALGYYALLWIAGSSGDVLNIAQYLPSAILPADLRPVIVVRTDALDRAEKQARYTAPIGQEALETADSGQDAVATDAPNSSTGEPLPLDVDTAQPLQSTSAPAAGQVVSPPSFTADELAVALRTAEEAQPGLIAGDLNDGREVQRAKGMGYSLLCDLAQKATFVDPAARADYVASLASKTNDLFRRTLADVHTRGEVAMIVRKWIESPHRKHGGVFFAGTVTRDIEQGSVVECQFDLGGGQSLTVLVPPASAGQLSDSPQPLGVVGWIVDNPAQNVSGYTGEAQQAIWAGQLIPLQ